jgi:hypothetical protein
MITSRVTSFLASLLFCIPVFLHAQTGNHKAYPLYSQAKKTTTLVVLEDEDCAYNKMMKESVERFWKFTPYEFIKQSEMPDYMMKWEYSMLIRNNRQFPLPNGHVQMHNDISLFMCNKETIMDYPGVDEIAGINLEDITLEDDYLYKLPGLIRAMQDYLAFLDEGDFDKTSLLEKLDKYENRRSEELSELTLLICEDDLPESLNNADMLESLYKYGIRTVDKDAITEAIFSEATNIAYVHLHAHNRKIDVISAKDGCVLYSASLDDYREGITEKDIRRISKKAS